MLMKITVFLTEPVSIIYLDRKGSWNIKIINMRLIQYSGHCEQCYLTMEERLALQISD